MPDVEVHIAFEPGAKRVGTLCRHTRRGAEALSFEYHVAWLEDAEHFDDHLRNHAVLWTGREGWTLSPVYDLNPTPTDVRPCILTTNISLDEATCDLDLAHASAEFFGMSLTEAKTISKEVAAVISTCERSLLPPEQRRWRLAG
jgi:serine/threonine-protein kinase HipA